MSVEGFNKRRNKKETLTAGFMTAAEARKHLDDAVVNLAVAELANALTKVKASIADGKNVTTFAFSYKASKEVIDATITLLKDMQYNVTPSVYYSDVIHITLPAEQ